MTALQAEIEQRLADAEPQVEVLLAELVPGPTHPTLRVFIDHPDGVTLSLCERVSGVLGELRDSYTLEVSSPGSERPLSKPDHFRRYLGHRARVRVRAQEGGRSGRRARGVAKSAEAKDACQPDSPPLRHSLHRHSPSATSPHSTSAGSPDAPSETSAHSASETSAHAAGAASAHSGSAASAHSAGAAKATRPVFRRSYTGELVGASDSEITLAAESGIVAIPYSDIRRCNLVEE